MANKELAIFLHMLGYHIGLTKRTRTYDSCSYETEGRVLEKSEEKDTIIMRSPDMGQSGPVREYVIPYSRYHITVITDIAEGHESKKFESYDKKWYDRLEEGDCVLIKYHDILRETFDYVPPDFSSKKICGPVTIDYSLEDIIKLD
jgi:hypothetical protein